MAKLREGMHRVEVLIAPEDYQELEKISQGARICMGPLIRAAIKATGKERLAQLAGNIRKAA